MLSTQKISTPVQTGEYAEPYKFLLLIMIFSSVMLVLTILMMWGMGAIIGDNMNTIFQIEGDQVYWPFL